MKDLIKQGNRSGLIIGVVLVFLILFGLTITLSEIVGDFLNLSSNTRTGNTAGLMVFFILLALWSGTRVSDNQKSNLKNSLVFGLSSGLVTGLIVSAFILLIGSLDAADVEMRDYLVQLNKLPSDRPSTASRDKSLRSLT